MQKLGLIGYPLSHSFSKKLFEEKFLKENIKGYQYDLFPIVSIDKLPDLLKNNPDIIGLNVTIPYKTAVIFFLDKLDETVLKAGAVNTIRIRDGKLTGYNTDTFGFERSLENFYIKSINDSALILGTGGSAKAVASVLTKKNIPFHFVSRSQKDAGVFIYSELNKEIIKKHKLIINCTPIGMYPETDKFPPIPYQGITSGHFLFDLIYNPVETLFLKKGKEKGAETKNGMEMLYQQALKAWEIWIK